ncbi:DUF3742 family protein [Pseudomonas oryzihabitans]|uniref:DUF3742 family protein n=1 Tax=Pseudomonas oryzihabitans TaxID=47885 RepID=UPI003F9A1E6E
MVSSARSPASNVGRYISKVLTPLFCIERVLAKALSTFGLSTTMVYSAKLLVRAVLIVFALLYCWMLVVPLVGFGLVAYVVVGGLDRNSSVASSLNMALKECDYNGSYRDGADGYGYYDNMGLKIHD